MEFSESEDLTDAPNEALKYLRDIKYPLSINKVKGVDIVSSKILYKVNYEGCHETMTDFLDEDDLVNNNNELDKNLGKLGSFWNRLDRLRNTSRLAQVVPAMLTQRRARTPSRRPASPNTDEQASSSTMSKKKPEISTGSDAYPAQTRQTVISDPQKKSRMLRSASARFKEAPATTTPSLFPENDTKMEIISCSSTFAAPKRKKVMCDPEELPSRRLRYERANAEPEETPVTTVPRLDAFVNVSGGLPLQRHVLQERVQCSDSQILEFPDEEKWRRDRMLLTCFPVFFEMGVGETFDARKHAGILGLMFDSAKAGVTAHEQCEELKMALDANSSSANIYTGQLSREIMLACIPALFEKAFGEAINPDKHHEVFATINELIILGTPVQEIIDIFLEKGDVSGQSEPCSQALNSPSVAAVPASGSSKIQDKETDYDLADLLLNGGQRDMANTRALSTAMKPDRVTKDQPGQEMIDLTVDD